MWIILRIVFMPEVKERLLERCCQREFVERVNGALDMCEDRYISLKQRSEIIEVIYEALGSPPKNVRNESDCCREVKQLHNYLGLNA